MTLRAFLRHDDLFSDVPDDLIRATPPLLADWVLGETGNEARA